MKAPISIFEYEDFIAVQRSIKGLRYRNGWFITSPMGWKKLQTLIKENRFLPSAVKARYLFALSVTSEISKKEKKRDTEGILRVASMLVEHFPKAAMTVLETYGTTVSKS